jgi:peptide/nickel transport system permease protein
VSEAGIVEMASGDSTPATVARRSVWRRVLRSPLGLICVLLLLTITVVGLLAPWLAPFDPNLTRLELTNAPPFTSDFVLGGDSTGRDILSRLMLATIGTLQATSLMLLVALAIGVTTGLVAGYYGGRFDDVADWVANLIMALPGFVLLIALYTVIGPNILLAMAVLGVLIAPSFFRLVRSLAQAVRHELYIDAARVAGLTDRRIMFRHVLRAVRGPLIVQSAFILAVGIGIQAGLEFLGLGDRSEPSWGGMLAEAFGNIYNNGIAIVWPALLIGITTLCLVLLGNVIRDGLQASGSRHAALPPKVRHRLQTEAGAQAPALPPPGGDPPLLRVHDLVLGYPDSITSVRPVVHGVDLTVERGEIHGLVGESGSGKSQIAFAVLGILPPEAVILRGAVEFSGQDLLADPGALREARGRRIAYVPQEPMSNLDPTYTVGQQLSFGLRAVKKVSKKQARVELTALLDRVGIKDPARVFDLYPHEISGGMAQRVLIAGALAGGPELLVADEPTTALDVTVQAEVLELLRELQQELGLGMLLVTHNFGVVADICDRVSVMRKGRIVESKPARELFAAPEHEYTQMLLSSTPESAGLRRPLAGTEVAR